jgi:hypothetical protein
MRLLLQYNVYYVYGLYRARTLLTTAVYLVVCQYEMVWNVVGLFLYEILCAAICWGTF